MDNVQQNKSRTQSPTIHHRDKVVSLRALSVRESVADEFANDVSENRELAEQLLVARSFPALANRADMDDELSWSDLLSMSVSEAESMEKDEKVAA
jgi:hypothetical protein